MNDIEIISEFLHEIWSHWFKLQHDVEQSSRIQDETAIQKVALWNKQSITSYQALSEIDKEKDRKLARVLLNRLETREKIKEVIV